MNLLLALVLSNQIYNQILEMPVNQVFLAKSLNSIVYKISYVDEYRLKHEFVRKVFAIPCNTHSRDVAVIALERKLVLNEISILSSLNHPNIIKIVPKYYDDNRCNIEYLMELGRRDLITIFEDQTIELPQLRFMLKRIARDMLNALEYLHFKNIAHLDIKPGNIVEFDSGFKLIDFGFAQRRKFVTLKTKSGTPGYLSPEMQSAYDGKRADTINAFKSDIYSLGASLWELYNIESEEDVECYKPSKSKEEEQDEFTTFINKLIHCDPESRSSIAVLKSDSWLL